MLGKLVGPMEPLHNCRELAEISKAVPFGRELVADKLASRMEHSLNSLQMLNFMREIQASEF
jgi:hypothetical protein